MVKQAITLILESNEYVDYFEGNVNATAFDTFQKDRGVLITFFELAHKNGLTVASDTGDFNTTTKLVWFNSGQKVFEIDDPYEMESADLKTLINAKIQNLKRNMQ